GRQYSVPAATAENAWLRYQNFVPSQNDWHFYLNQTGQFTPPAPTRITDVYAYNDDPHNDWVGDLAVEAEIGTMSDGGEITLELIKGGKAFHAILDLQQGLARLEIPGLPSFKPEPVKIDWKGAGKHKLLFANVDCQLWLLIDGESVFST